MPQQLYNSIGDPISLGGKLGQGGEGAIYELSGLPDLVAKLYHVFTDSPLGP